MALYSRLVQTLLLLAALVAVCAGCATPSGGRAEPVADVVTGVVTEVVTVVVTAPQPTTEVVTVVVTTTPVPPTVVPAPTHKQEVLTTALPTWTLTPEPTALPTATQFPTWTPSPVLTPTDTLVPTATLTPTVAFTATPEATATPAIVGELATVTAVIDGDTIEVSVNGASYRVRYIGMDTPETGDVCGSEAKAANAALVAGQTVRMVKDVSETDRYGRLLRYVYVGDTFVNGALVAGGWAQAVDYPPDTAMSGLLHSLTAQGAGRGCALVAAPLPTEPVRAPDPIPVGNCDPSYPTVCIPPPPPDLDCGDIPYRRFQVLPPDPHRFDGDHDGVGCESG